MGAARVGQAAYRARKDAVVPGGMTRGKSIHGDYRATPERVPEEAEGEIQIPTTPEREPPASTAPARLVSEGGSEGGEGRGKRERKMTEAYR